MHSGQDDGGGDITAAGDPPLVFRLRPYYLAIGIVCALGFATMGFGSVVAAYWNIDGSFPHPVQSAIVLGVGWGAFVLLSVWVIAAYFREQLELHTAAISQQGVVRKRIIDFHRVSSVNWHGGITNGVIVIRTPASRCKIYLDNFTSAERRTIVDFLRSAVPTDVHEGWDEFAEAETRAAQPRPNSMGAAVECVVVLLAASAAFIVCWHHWDLDNQWLFVGVGCAIAALWWVWRIRRFIKERPVQTSEQV